MENNIYINLTDDAEPPQWFDAEKIKVFLMKVFDTCEYKNWELSVLFCSNTFIQNLNSKYRGIDEATDVLSFSQTENTDDMPVYLSNGTPHSKTENIFFAGDIVISFEYLQQNAKYFNVDETEELKRLLIHGVLHLAGFNHATNDTDEPMLKLQEEILNEVNNGLI